MIGLLLWSTVALAADGLVWTWNAGQPVRYHLQTTVETPATHFWYGTREKEVRATHQTLSVQVSCSGAVEGKKWAVHCPIESVEIRGQGVPDETADLRMVMDQSVALLEGKSVQLIMGSDGRIKKLELKGIDVTDSRVGIMAENLRQMLRRAFAPMDMQLPKDGQDKGKPWRQKGAPLAVSLFGDQGTSGGVVMKRRVVSADGAQVSMAMEARGSMALGATMEEGTLSILRVNCDGRSGFNTDLGVLDWAQVTTRSAYGTSNLGALSGVPPSRFSSKLARVLPDGSMLLSYR